MRKSNIYLFSTLILITGLTVYCFNLSNRTAKFIGRDKLNLQVVYFPDIPDAEYIMYDIVNRIDSDGYTSQYPYFYTQVYRISEEEQDSVKKERYRIDIQWKSSELCENDSAIGFLWQDGIDTPKNFILTSTDMEALLSIVYSTAFWGSFPDTNDTVEIKDNGTLFLRKREPVRPNYDRDTIISTTAILEQYLYPDTVITYYMIEGGGRFNFDKNKYIVHHN